MRRRLWLEVSLAVVALVPAACSFLSDFPDVETDPGAATTSSGSGSSATTGDSSASASSATSSTGSGMCGVTFCDGPACASPFDDTRAGFSTAMAESNTFSQGFAEMDNEVFVSVSNKDPVKVVPDTLTIEGGGATTGQFVYRVSGTREFVARAYECHAPNGYLFATPFTSTDDRFVLGLTTPSPSTENLARLTVDRNAAGAPDCAGAVDGRALQNGALVPYLATFQRQPGDQLVFPATDDATTSKLGVRAAYLAVAGRGTVVAVFGVAVHGEKIFGEDVLCAAGMGPCRFVAAFDLGSGTPTMPLFVDVIPDFDLADGPFPNLIDNDADIAIDEAGTVWAVATNSNAQVGVYRHRSGDIDGTVAFSQSAMAIRGRAIAVQGGRVYVAGSVIGDLQFGTATRPGNGTSRDLFVAAFDASTFDASPEPLWLAPTEVDPGYAVANDDDGNDIVVVAPDGCTPSVYVVGCVADMPGGGCTENPEDATPSHGLVVRLGGDGKLLRTTAIAPDQGWLSARHAFLDPQAARLWTSFEFMGNAFSFASAPGIPAVIVAAFPL